MGRGERTSMLVHHCKISLFFLFSLRKQIRKGKILFVRSHTVTQAFYVQGID